MVTPSRTTSAVPATATAPAVAQSVQYELECVKIESMDTAVQVMEKGGLHSCVRRVYFYEFEYKDFMGEHPVVQFTLKALSPQGYEVKKRYKFAITKV